VLGVAQELLLEVLLVEEGEPHDGEGREEDVVKLVEPLLVQRLPPEGRSETVPELRQHEDYVLVEDVADKERVPPVGLPAVCEEQVLQEPELPDRVVCRPRRLLTL
jgi:hypothetical protein